MIKHEYLPFEYKISKKKLEYENVIFTEDFGPIKKGNSFSFADIEFSSYGLIEPYHVLCLTNSSDDLIQIKFEIKSVYVI